MTSNLDGGLAGGRGFGSLTAGIPPVIDSATNGLIMNGQTLQARVTARHLGKHIPGNPSIVVQNMPSRIAAANHVFGAAPKDGATACPPYWHNDQ